MLCLLSHAPEYRAPPGYHPIDMSYPGLRLLHREPDIFLVDEFLTPAECSELQNVALEVGLRSSTAAVPAEDVAHLTGFRTSEHATLPQRATPAIVAKMQRLLQCRPQQMQQLEVVRYMPGQYFKPHCDSVDGLMSRAGYDDSTRLATLITYLNSVDEGGETFFSRLDLKVKPRQGTALVHFPASHDLVADKRTMHCGMVSPNVKWVCTAFMWRDGRSSDRDAWGEAAWPEIG